MALLLLVVCPLVGVLLWVRHNDRMIEDQVAALRAAGEPITPEDAERWTEALIERVLAIGGSYYLPYRPHARLDQLTRAYPRAAELVALKLRYDPQLRFRNRFWDRYLAPLADGTAR